VARQLVAQHGANARREAEDVAAAGQIATEAEARRTQRLAEARADETRLTGLAEGDAETARLAAYRDLPEAVLAGLALKELAANLPKIDSLVLTPDLLAPLLTRLGTTRH
jgi:regulator of protease activity HflC (stomatin/prohibitin superfamily)